jgi:hypothetical protein
MTRFDIKQSNKGWTVVIVTGSKKTGRTIQVAPEFADWFGTMHQAQMAATNANRDAARFA